MLTKPDLPDEEIIACLQTEYEIRAAQVFFLPLGADRNTAVYRVVADDEAQHFLKLRRGIFDETSVTLPKYLSNLGIEPIIAPVATRTGQLWASMDVFKVILYPFVAGQDGFDLDLSDRQWVDLGTALKSIHSAALPPTLARRIRQETYSPHWRKTLKTFLARIEDDAFEDSLSERLAAFLRIKRAEIFDLVGRAERVAVTLQAQSPDFVLCHSDIHAGNILIDASGALFIVDWDEPILAPKERDLMFIGDVWYRTAEEALFYQGYGRTQIDPVALAYYRYERIVEDTAIFCERIFLSAEGSEDREQCFRFLSGAFLPNHVIDIAYRSDITGGRRSETLLMGRGLCGPSTLRGG